MSTIHPYRLRPYHNPENLDESRVPPGYRFRYADEIRTPVIGALHFVDRIRWKRSVVCGTGKEITYIVPVEA